MFWCWSCLQADSQLVQTMKQRAALYKVGGGAVQSSVTASGAEHLVMKRICKKMRKKKSCSSWMNAEIAW